MGHNKSWWVWINRNSLDSFTCECWKCNILIPKEIRKFIGYKDITTNIYRIQSYDSIMCGCIDFMLKGKSLLEYRNLFYPNKYKKNDKIILKYFQ